MSRPRKRARLEEPQPTYDVPPTASEWEAMKCYGSFTIIDQEQKPHMFHTGDDIFVLPTLPDGKDPSSLAKHDLWVAKIDAIRAQASHNAWMRVQWYYHPEELRSCVPSFQSQFCGALERVLSTHFDIIPTISCNGEVVIVKLDEKDPIQILPSGSFFYRLTYNVKTYKNRKGHSHQVTPFLLNCICRSPYGPDIHTMRWCPNCRMWFHKDCLKIKKSKNLKSNYSLDESFETHLRGRKLARKEYRNFVDGLRSLVDCPISKGQEYGVVGNLPYVCRAKDMLQQIISEGDEFKVPDNWMAHLGLTHGWKLESDPWRLCPLCGSLI